MSNQNLNNLDDNLNNLESNLNNLEGENNAQRAYFFAKHGGQEIKVEKQNISKKLKSTKKLNYTTVFMVDNIDVCDIDEIASKDYTTSTLNDAKEKVKTQKKNGTKWFNIIFFIVNVVILAIVLIYQSNTVGVAPIETLFENARFGRMCYIFLIFVLIMFFEALRTHILLYNATKQFRPFLCYKSAAILRYYDCITPFAACGQPFEIFYLHSRGVNSGIATSVPLTKAIFNNIAFTLTSIIILIFNSNLFGGESQKVIIIWSIISLAISCLILFVLLLFAISRRTMPKILMFFLKFGEKIHLIKDSRLTFNRYMRTIFEYQKSTKFYITNFWVTFFSILTSSAIVILKAFIPFVLYWAFNGVVTSSTLLEIISKFILVELATKYIPVPGGSGLAEISFTALFASLFNDGTLFWAMLIWRIMNYFIYLIQGFIVIIYDFLHGNKKNEKHLQKLAAIQDQINETTKKQINKRKHS